MPRGKTVPYSCSVIAVTSNADSIPAVPLSQLNDPILNDDPEHFYITSHDDTCVSVTLFEK